MKMRGRGFGLALIGLALAMPAMAQAEQAPTGHALAAPEASIQLERWRTRWVLPVTVGGKPRKLLFDTGGGITALSRETVTDAGCTPWGRLTGFRMFGDRGDGGRCTGVTVAMPGYSVTPPAMGLINLGKLNPADAPLDGLASLNLFDGKTITLDLAHGRLVVESAASRTARIATMMPLKVRLVREVQGLALAVMVEVPTPKGPVWMELDSGNGGTVLVARHVAEAFGLDPVAEGKQTARFAITPAVTVNSADAFTPDMIMDGNLGMPFLKNWILTFDLKDGSAWIAPAAQE
ncbi:hypothetical protein NX02_20935 [Sphingomonas sanxanigenens DSM 19645 = NX02]|uniref:Peptidase A2 domain-containing protein n=2 Tax=Sphingomonas sanxanigenens TaxID=397260 RepID=W0AHP9_9SPHN|nr:hypothetical protein NX02_20935 [Sphingomonas sanxanigenens DSM 19645 = NX02]